jgi:hypothetical protein
VLLACCLEGVSAAHQRCRTCKKKHGPPRGRDCPTLAPQEDPEDPFADVLPTCHNCNRQHASPRGRDCDYGLFDDQLHDPFMDHPVPQREGPVTRSTDHLSQVLLTRLSGQISEMNANVVSLNQRVVALETNTPTRAVPAPTRDPLGPEGALRARMQALDLDPDEGDAADDDWEVAGAGAALPGPGLQGKQLKSGALIPAQHDVIRQLDYPHKHVMRGAGRPAPLALDLTLSEFVFGYAEMLEAPTIDPTLRANMLRFLKILMDDANVRPWAQVRHFHMSVIQSMETGQLQWGDTERILAIQRQHSRAAPSPSPAPMGPRRAATSTRTANGVNTPMYCLLYQSNSCDRASDHESPRGFVYHICAFCLKTTGRSIPSNGEADCRRKRSTDEGKNDS